MQDPVDDPPGCASERRVRPRPPALPFARWTAAATRGGESTPTRATGSSSAILSRLTRIDVQPIETIIDIDSDEIFDLPFLFAISVGDWQLSSSQAQRLRKYFDRGGFLMVDDFHNEREWANFMDGMRQIDPSLQADELDDDDPAFHVLFDLKERVRVPGANVVHGSGIERGGTVPHWRAIRDSHGRMMVAISFNQDVGDGWEFADDPSYPEKFASQAIRIGTNYVVYSMTH